MRTREKQENLNRAMTVEELMGDLQNMPPEAKVVFVCNYGDYHRTQQALPVQSVDEESSLNLVDSAYSQSRMALEERQAAYFCPKCEEEWAMSKCPKCGTRTVDESGVESSEEDDEEQEPIVVLRFTRENR